MCYVCRRVRVAVQCTSTNVQARRDAMLQTDLWQSVSHCLCCQYMSSLLICCWSLYTVYCMFKRLAANHIAKAQQQNKTEKTLLHLTKVLGGWGEGMGGLKAKIILTTHISFLVMKVVSKNPL